MDQRLIMILVISAMALALIVQIIVIKLRRTKRRALLLDMPKEQTWDKILAENVALYKYLPDDKKHALWGHMHIFMEEKHFEGCKGLEMTETIKVTIAAQACMLLLGQTNPTYYPKLNSILVYPHAYVAQDFNGTVAGDSCRLGESWQGGNVVLAWDHTRQKVIDLKDGHNLVLHEFAHQLDQEDGASDGAPILSDSTKYTPWAQIMVHELDHLKQLVKKHKRDVMDKYGATNPAEFFAVATETFFEKGKSLKKKHPELYTILRDYYKLDPAEWF